MEYISIAETAERWGISARRIRTLCMAERIPGAQRVGICWVIPAQAVKPADRRLKSAEDDAKAFSRTNHKRRP